MKTISPYEAKEIFAHISGAKPITIIAVTDARLKKTNNPLIALGNVYKVAKINGMANTDHETAVNRQAARENIVANYQSGERSWGTRIGNGGLVEYKGAYFVPIQINPISRARPIYLAPKMRGTKVRLTPVAKEELAPFLPADQREAHSARQGVERSVERRDFRLDSIVQFSLDGEKYRIRS